MAVDLAYDLWTELKRYIHNTDRNEAADVLVNLLVDHDYDAEDIRSVFKGDADVKRALQTYLEDEVEDDDEEYDEDYDEEDY